MRVRFARVAGALMCCGLLVAGLSSPVGASTIVYRTDAELVALSERVVHARVLSQRYERPLPNGPIYTVTTMAVLEDLTGVPGETVETWELGGIYDGEIMYVGGAVMYEVGEEVLVCLERGRRGLRSAAMAFSRFTVQRTSTRAGRADGRLLRGVHDTMVVGAPAVLPRERTLDEFRALARQVRGVASIRNEAADSLEPEGRVSAAYTLLTFSNGLSARWTQADTGTPVIWYRNDANPAPLLSGNGDAEIQTALAAWTNPASASLILQFGGTTTLDDTNALPGTGVILYEDPHEEIGNTTSTLAIGGGFAFFGGGGTVNGTSFNRFTRGYVIFQNASRLCTMAGSFCQSTNFTRVMQHEIGHGIGFGHTQTDGTVPNPASNIMYPSCCSGSPTPPALGPDDLAALTFVYPAGTGGGCSYSLTPTGASVASGGGSGSFTVNSQAGCGWTATSNNGFISVTGGASGTGSGRVSYSAAANGLTQRTGTITAGGRTFTIAQNGTGPTMAVSRTSLRFGATHTGAAFSAKTGAQTLRITQSGAGAVTWTASSNQPWLTVSPTSGSAPATLTVNVQNSGGVPVQGTSTAAITLTFTGAGAGAGPIAVTLTTMINGTSSAPIGSFDTPADLATGVTGSVALTGWALDDVDVTAVRILRSTITGICHAPVPIGTATMVDGARTDLVGVFPTYPRNTRGGWGYMLLTNFLPDLGNGTFTLCAVADDAEGGSALLGVKTMTVTNSSAVKPFGAIDTPAPGSTISGTSYNNFGWVLSPAPGRADPPNGGSVTVFINGAPVGAPSGWTNRSDLAALFPSAQYPGIGNAAGVFTFNPQTYGEGVHTIAWSVTNNLGETDGIGSRYFSVITGAAVEAGAVDAGAVVAAGVAREIAEAPSSRAAIRARRGFDLDTPLRAARADAEGRALLDGEELDRFELHLRPGLAGYLRVDGDLSPLPIGSHLDPVTGTFTWQPGVGFVGRYDLVFVERSGGRAVSRQEVRIRLHPKGSNRVGPQVTIDTPSFGDVVPGDAGQLRVAGWAIDLDDAAGTGVGALHVWAYPVDPLTGHGAGVTSPTFLGLTAYGGARPDVAAVFGDQYLHSGYDLVAGDLTPGTYDIAVFAWSTVRHAFVPARVVRVQVR